MKKREALAVFNSRIVNGNVNVEFLHDKEELKKEIRILSDLDEGFEDTVFELGVSVLAKTFLKVLKEMRED